MEEAMSIRELVTHDGRFHADEVFSSAVLKAIFPDAKIIRTRDRSMTSPAPGRIIYDVGGDYDAGRMIFDHHQVGPPKRKDGTPYSSFGMIWGYFGRKWLETRGTPAGDVASIHASFDQDFVRLIDMLDNGIWPSPGSEAMQMISIPAIVEDFMPAFDEANLDRAGFDLAVFFASRFLGMRLKHYKAERRAFDIVSKAVMAAGASRYIEISADMPYRSALKLQEAHHIQFVIHPRSDGMWVAATVPNDTHVFAPKHPFPKPWAGLETEALQEATGVSDAEFCHAALFVAIARSRSGAIALVEAAMR